MRVWKPDFEFVYLAVLTAEGIKPLSRYEGMVSEGEIRLLGELGLKYRPIERLTLSGRPVRELIFSLDDALIRRYEEAFEGKPLTRSPEAIRLEGELFGYPRCCVESFIKRGYAPNGLKKRDQRILFHWACPSCSETPKLIPLYRRARRRARLEYLKLRLRSAILPRLSAPLAAAFILAASSAPLLANPVPIPDPHRLPVQGDVDGDGLKDSEEPFFKLDPKNPDTDGDGLSDGEELARELLKLIASLPTSPSDDRPYKIDRAMRGLERCSACGELVNMGFIEVVNPIRGERMEIPYVALHYMEHGSFSFKGELHTGRVDPVRLWELLERPSGAGPKGRAAWIWGKLKSLLLKLF